MAYEPKTWVCGETITAEALNHMERGIEANQPMILTLGGTTQEEADAALAGNAYLSATWQEINDAFRAGKRIVVELNPYIGEMLGQFASEVLLVGNGEEGAMYFTKPTVVIQWTNTGNAGTKWLKCDNATDRPYMTGTVG